MRKVLSEEAARLRSPFGKGAVCAHGAIFPTATTIFPTKTLNFYLQRLKPITETLFNGTERKTEGGFVLAFHVYIWMQAVKRS